MTDATNSETVLFVQHSFEQEQYYLDAIGPLWGLSAREILPKDHARMNFDDFDLIEPIRKALAEQNYQTPTPVQEKAIPPAIRRRDILGSAQTGTGKTAAFSIPILQRLGKTNRKAKPRHPLALVLAPTRELAIQISESLDTYGSHLKLRQALVFGGVSQNRQVRSLERGAHILVATPGRLLDLMNQGFIDLGLLKIFVLDEADRMLDMGFMPDLKKIIKCLPEKRQSMFFSATLPPKIIQLANSLLDDPFRVSIAPKTKSVDLIQQQVLYIERPAKLEALREILKSKEASRAIVFTRTKRGANTLAERLDRNGIRATAIHGNKSQNARQRALESFRNKKVNVLVATDVAARGIDVDGVSHVVNYDVPDDPDSYIHRIGRTGRAGAEGTAIIFCSQAERNELRAIEKILGRQIPLAPNQPAPPVEREDDGRPKNRFRRTRPRGGRPGDERKEQRGGPRGRKRTRGKNTTPKTTAGPRKATGKQSVRTKTAAATSDSVPADTPVSQKPKRKRRPRKGKNARLREKQQAAN